MTVQMKNSGVGWLGKVPAHWDVVQSRRLFRERNEKANQTDRQLTVSQKHGLLPQAEFMAREGRRIVVVQKGHDILKRTMPGDFVISMRSFQGGLELSGYEGSVSSAYVPLVPLKWVVPRYFRWAFKSTTYVQALQSTSDLVRDGQALRFENFSKVPLPVVPVAEQTTIADFLDRATARIDTLVRKKIRFIELLREKRQAKIAHIVTKGLDASVPMKDSGVEWLGEVPEHWGVVQSRRLFRERNERARPADEQLTVSQKYGLLPQVEFMERERQRIVVVQKGHDILKRVMPGDFVISMRSFQGGLELSEYEGSISSAYVPLTPIKWIVPRFFRWVFKSLPYVQALQSTSDLVRDGQALRFENFSKVALPNIPVAEQTLIADFLDRATTRIDTLIAKTEHSIELLREHRAALISAAVTGKIDQRDLA